MGEVKGTGGKAVGKASFINVQIFCGIMQVAGTGISHHPLHIT
jgi:hypothetical protein